MADTVKIYLHRKRGFRVAGSTETTFYGPGAVDVPEDVARLFGFRIANQPTAILSGPLAIALADAGYDTPGKIKAATDEQLLAVDGVGPKTLETIRTKYGRQE